ncbi:MAG: hypothetical protein MI749_08825 [Desulfovibrionales bacterium]|nr:hypothetical protein [Desulfovibrionales bacterium]
MKTVGTIFSQRAIKALSSRAAEKPVFVSEKGNVHAGRSWKGKFISMLEHLHLFSSYTRRFRNEEREDNMRAADVIYNTIARRHGADVASETALAHRRAGGGGPLPIGYKQSAASGTLMTCGDIRKLVNAAESRATTVQLNVVHKQQAEGGAAGQDEQPVQPESAAKTVGEAAQPVSSEVSHDVSPETASQPREQEDFSLQDETFSQLQAEAADIVAENAQPQGASGQELGAEPAEEAESVEDAEQAEDEPVAAQSDTDEMEPVSVLDAMEHGAAKEEEGVAASESDVPEEAEHVAEAQVEVSEAAAAQQDDALDAAVVAGQPSAAELEAESESSDDVEDVAIRAGAEKDGESTEEPLSATTEAITIPTEQVVKEKAPGEYSFEDMAELCRSEGRDVTPRSIGEVLSKLHPQVDSGKLAQFLTNALHGKDNLFLQDRAVKGSPELTLQIADFFEVENDNHAVGRDKTAEKTAQWESMAAGQKNDSPADKQQSPPDKDVSLEPKSSDVSGEVEGQVESANTQTGKNEKPFLANETISEQVVETPVPKEQKASEQPIVSNGLAQPLENKHENGAAQPLPSESHQEGLVDASASARSEPQQTVIAEDRQSFSKPTVSAVRSEAVLSQPQVVRTVLRETEHARIPYVVAHAVATPLVITRDILQSAKHSSVQHFSSVQDSVHEPQKRVSEAGLSPERVAQRPALKQLELAAATHGKQYKRMLHNIVEPVLQKSSAQVEFRKEDAAMETGAYYVPRDNVIVVKDSPILESASALAAVLDDVLFESFNARQREAYLDAENEVNPIKKGQSIADLEYVATLGYIKEVNTMSMMNMEVTPRGRRALSWAVETLGSGGGDLSFLSSASGSENEQLHQSFLVSPHDTQAKTGIATMPTPDLYKYESIRNLEENEFVALLRERLPQKAATTFGIRTSRRKDPDAFISWVKTVYPAKTSADKRPAVYATVLKEAGKVFGRSLVDMQPTGVMATYIAANDKIDVISYRHFLKQ